MSLIDELLRAGELMRQPSYPVPSQEIRRKRKKRSGFARIRGPLAREHDDKWKEDVRLLSRRLHEHGKIYMPYIPIYAAEYTSADVRAITSHLHRAGKIYCPLYDKNSDYGMYIDPSIDPDIDLEFSREPDNQYYRFIDTPSFWDTASCREAADEIGHVNKVDQFLEHDEVTFGERLDELAEFMQAFRPSYRPGMTFEEADRVADERSKYLSRQNQRRDEALLAVLVLCEHDQARVTGGWVNGLDRHYLLDRLHRLNYLVSYGQLTGLIDILRQRGSLPTAKRRQPVLDRTP